MNGKKAKRLRREVREFFGMETIRTKGVDVNKVGVGYYVHVGQKVRVFPDGTQIQTSTVQMDQACSRKLYKRAKKVDRQLNKGAKVR